MNIKKTTTLFLSLSILTFLGGCETEEETTPAPTGAVESSYAEEVHDEPYEFTDETGTYLIDKENATKTPIFREGDVVGEDAYASTEGTGKGEVDFNFTYSYDDGDYTEMLTDVAKEVEKPLSKLTVLSAEKTMVGHIKPVNTIDEQAMDIKEDSVDFANADRSETTSKIFVMKKSYDQIMLNDGFGNELPEPSYLYGSLTNEEVQRENGSPLSEDMRNIVTLYETDDVVVVLVIQDTLMGPTYRTLDDDESVTTPYEEKSVNNIVNPFMSENAQDVFAKHLN
ncbi:hypothetical protein CAR_50p520 (plasmid) [Carnobacterium sp. 17-4]|uniref:hypothetical protein n=1 Tax=Carnobacterium sp. (strain 17-4) TaxID=208596 RepID=UPI00020584AE|nr:hypothetical protein [Carnobacterium sp. 17-4]AEB31224.1 hypothetical protein CAR_50p520 [Carnobacterium sp. 17-4]